MQFCTSLTLILLYIARKLNKAWIDRYQYLDCREVSCALVQDKEYKYIRYWDSKGRRICRSLLDMHLGKKTPDDEMEYTIRHVFIAGMAAGDEYSNELLKQISSLKKQLDASETEQKKLQEHIDTVVKRKVEAHEDTLLAENAQQKKRISILKDEIRDLNKSLKEAQKAAQKAEFEQHEAENKCRRIQDNLEYQKNLNQHMEEELNKSEYINNLNLQDKNIILQTDLNACRENLDSTSQLLAFREQEILQLKQQLDQAISKIEQLTEMNDQENLYLAPVQLLPIHDEADTTGTHPGKCNKGGRPSKLSPEDTAELIAARRRGVHINDLSKKYGIAKSTVSSICKSAGIGIDIDKNAI